ncbi:nicotinamide-nucleotide amidohydrolase family protein [Aliiglaciecola litoralis]|uniref:Nicotinamide-nucleotide amidase n=1 Tax=Aliiglaciecola litoralis TaxID=582857 RepID=A0ABP3WUR1_9ALTE
MLTQSIYSLANSLGEKLAANKQHISCAESCTGGGLAFALTSVAGSSNWFKQSYVTYSNQAKHDLLGVSLTTLNEQGAVSQPTVEQMAAGCAKSSCAEVAVAISGIAGPGGGSDDKPVGLVWFGFWIDGNLSCESRVFTGDRHQVRIRAIAFAMQYVLTNLQVASV